MTSLWMLPFGSIVILTSLFSILPPMVSGNLYTLKYAQACTALPKAPSAASLNASLKVG